MGWWGRRRWARELAVHAGALLALALAAPRAALAQVTPAQAALAQAAPAQPAEAAPAFELSIDCDWLSVDEVAEVESRLHGEVVLLEPPPSQLRVRCVDERVETEVTVAEAPRTCSAEPDARNKGAVLSAATECLVPAEEPAERAPTPDEPEPESSPAEPSEPASDAEGSERPSGVWFTTKSRAFVLDASFTYDYLGPDFAGALGGELGLAKWFGGVLGARLSLGGGAAVGGPSAFAAQQFFGLLALELRALPVLTLGGGVLLHALSFDSEDSNLVAERSTSLSTGAELHAALHSARPFGVECLVRGRFLGAERQVTSSGTEVLSVPAWSFGLALGVRWAMGE